MNPHASPERILVTLLRWSEKYTKTDMVYLASGGFWLTLEIVIAALCSLALSIVFGHFATKDLYGNYKYVLSLASLISAISLTGMSNAVGQATSVGKEGSLRQGFRLNLYWSAPMSLVALGVALYYYTQGNSFVALSLCVVAVATPLLSSFSLFDNFLGGRREFPVMTFFSGFGNITSMIALIVALFIGGRAIWLVVAYYAVNTATSAYFYYRTVRRAANDAEDPGMFSYSLHLSALGVIGTIANQIDSIVVFTFLGPVNLAIYTFAIAMPEQIKSVVKNVSSIALPKFAQRTLGEINETIWYRLAGMTFWLTVIIGLYIALAPLIFKLLFPVYVGSIWYSQVYALSIIVTGIPMAVTSILVAHKKTRELYIVSNAGQIVFIIAILPLTFYFGILGTIAAQIIYRIANALISLWQFAVAERRS